MASGQKALRKIQIGQEDYMGTPVAATAALLGQLTMEDKPTDHEPDEERGNLADKTRSVRVANLANLVFSGDATFEQLMYWLEMGIQGDVTPTPVGAAHLWTFTPNLTAAGTFNSFTLEHGDNIQAWETEFCMAREIEIAFAMNAAATVKATLFGRKKTPTSFTNSLAPPTVESIVGQNFKLYLDDEDGTMGYTVKSQQIIAATFTIKTGLVPVRYGDGSLDFSTYFEQPKGIDLKMTFAFNSDAEAERVLYDGETLRLVRLYNKGSLISGSDYKSLCLDMCGKYTSFSTLEDRDGEDVVNVTLHSQLGANYTDLFEVAVQNTVDALP